MNEELELLKQKTITLTVAEVRFNHNHGKDGRFTSGGGSKAAAVVAALQEVLLIL